MNKRKEEEAAYQKQQALTDRKDAAWATRPVMSAYCGKREADNVYLIAEVKNRDRQCADFEAGRPELHRCTDCIFRVAATGNAIDAKQEKRFADSSLMNTAVGTRKTVVPNKIAPFLGSYHNNELGDVKLVLHEDNTLWVDFGEYESLIRPLITEENQFIFFESVFIGKTLQLKINTGGSPSIRWSGNEGIYDFVPTNEQE